MTQPQEKKSDEDRFAEQLARMHQQIRSGEDSNDNASQDRPGESPESMADGEPMAMAGRVLALIERVRR